MSISGHTDMIAFWKEHSKKGSMSEMFLDENHMDFAEDDTAEVLGYLPDFAGKDVIELGAGIGRFTPKFAQLAKSVRSSDAMQTFIDQNKETNSHFSNVKFSCDDAASIDFEANSADLVFTNWLLMYLPDDESYDLLDKWLKWLRPGGYAFVRESCFHSASGVAVQRKRKFNPTIYRKPLAYSTMFQLISQKANVKGQEKSMYKFQVVSSSSVQTYVKHKQNPFQIWWLLQKVVVEDVSGGLLEQGKLARLNLQLALDQNQYTASRLKMYEFIFGEGHTGTGGDEVILDLGRLLKLEPGKRVLEIASGLGGSAMCLAKNFGVEVLGVDISCNMVGLALDKLENTNDENLQSKVQFLVTDAVTMKVEEEKYDAIFSRDAILHIPIELRVPLFQQCLKALKPGGKIYVIDYCCVNRDTMPQDMRDYFDSRGYHVISTSDYAQLLEKAGFKNAKGDDYTKTFITKSLEELEQFEKRKGEWIQTFGEESAEEFDVFAKRWRFKLDHCASGQFVWGWVHAEK